MKILVRIFFVFLLYSFGHPAQTAQAQLAVDNPSLEFSFPGWNFFPPQPPAPSSAGNTTLFIGHVDGRAPNSLTGFAISTADIDPALARFTNLGPNFTANQAESLFQDINDLEDELSATLTELLLNIDVAAVDITSVRNLSIETTPLNISLSQTGTSINAAIQGVSARASVRIRVNGFFGLFCRNASGTILLDNVIVSSSFNAFTGNIENTDLALSAEIEDASCAFSAILGIVGAKTGGKFGKAKGVILGGLAASQAGRILPLDGIATGLLNTQLSNLIEGAIDEANMLSFFGIQDFTNALREYADLIDVVAADLPDNLTIGTSGLGAVADILNLPASVSVTIPSTDRAVSEEINMLLDTADGIIGNFQGTNLQLDVFVDDGPDNQISFVVSNVPELNDLSAGFFTAQDRFTNTLYFSYQGITEPTPITYFINNSPFATDTTPGNGFLQFTPLPRGNGRFTATTENNLIGGLYSFAEPFFPQRVDLRSNAEVINFLEIFGRAQDAVGLNEIPPPPTPRPRPRPRPNPTPPPPGEGPPCPTCPFQ